MEFNDALRYIASLETRILHLQQILKHWVHYIPQDVMLQYEIPQELDSSHTLQLQAPQVLPAAHGRKKAPSSSPKSEELWKKPLLNLIQTIPSAEKWSGTISTPRVSVLDVLFEIEAPLNERDSTTFQYQHADILQTLGNYASLTETCANDAKWTIFLVKYRKFMLAALCHVACCIGVDPQLVNDMMKFISKAKSDHLQELRHGAAWGAEAIDRLQIESNWDIRSGDILFYCQIPSPIFLLRS